MVDLERQARLITELQQRLVMVTAMVKKVESEIADCERVEKQVLENVRVLRVEKVVVSVQEYKAVLKDLYQVRQGMIRLRSYRLDRIKEQENCTRALAQSESVFQKAELDQKNTVVHVNFGGKHGQR